MADTSMGDDALTNLDDHTDTTFVPTGHSGLTTETLGDGNRGIGAAGTGALDKQTPMSQPVQTVPKVRQGLTQRLPSLVLRRRIWLRTLTLANRFRVIRTVDVAAHCFPERDYKAALTAAQRAMRGLVKAGLLRRYRTDRFQTVYGLTQAGAGWLEAADVAAAASVRRVSDMSNPEHRLWAQFLVLCAESRGVAAQTEAELMQFLNPVQGASTRPSVSGPLEVRVHFGSRVTEKALRPDALLIESDGATWIEVDRSARGSARAADLRALGLSLGAVLVCGQVLRRLVVFTRTERIRRRVVATLSALAERTRDAALVRGRRQIRPVAGAFEVWMTTERRHRDRRVSLVDELVGHIVVQELPTWLPRVRLDGRGTSCTDGWFGENYLPYRRPAALPPWPNPPSPLIESRE